VIVGFYFIEVSSTNSKSSCSLVLSAYDIVQLAVKSFSRDNLKPVEVCGILELLLMDTPEWYNLLRKYTV